MALCEVCQKVDIRNLLLLSLENKEEWYDDEILHPSIYTSSKYHDSIFSVGDGVEAGCQLCALIWVGCTKSKRMSSGTERSEFTDAGLADFIGEIFLGTGSWGEFEGSKPLVIVTSRRPGDDETQLSSHCQLEVFARRGKQFLR